MTDDGRSKRLMSSHYGHLTRLDSDLITQVASFVGTSHQLLDLALTCKSFGSRQPGSGMGWSLAEEVARQVVCSGQNDIEGARITLSPYVRGTTTWLSILHETENRLKFDTILGRGIEHRSRIRSTVHGCGGFTGTAIANNYVMVSGLHYAEFMITGDPHIGIVRPIPNLDPDRFVDGSFHFFQYRLRPDFLAQKANEWCAGDVHACEYFCGNGTMNWTNWDDIEDNLLDWEGREGSRSGDTVGMLLNLDEGTLTVYKNKRCLGVMRGGLSGSYCWFATVMDKCAVSVERCNLPMA